MLKQRCLACHNTETKKAGLDLSSRDSLLHGGDSGPAVVLGSAKESLLFKLISHQAEPGMPYKAAKLPDELIGKIGAWIDAGAPFDTPLKIEAGQSPMKPRNTHWAFQQPKRPAIPVVNSSKWVRNPIDEFIAAEQEKQGLKPLPPAEKRVLLRRVYLDLIGLPPTPQEIRTFVEDASPDAYEKVVDRLLSSARYGERWGRHWMDVWRYSDWYGRRDLDEQRQSSRHIWRWRDWIVESVNEDKGYDRMIVEMLAGDEIAPADPKTLRATGYLARSYFRFNRNVWLQDTVEYTAASFLGITLKCARCHDHKYDPIEQEEYYKFRAFFEPHDVRIDQVSGQPDTNKDGLPRVFEAEPRDAPTEAPFFPAIFKDTFRLIRGDEKQPDTKPLSPGVPEILGNSKLEVKPVELPREAYNPDLRAFVQHDLIARAKEEITEAEAAVKKAESDIAAAKERLAKGEAPASTPVDPARAISFDKGIKPILERSCTVCHSAQNDRSGLNLATTDSILRGGAKYGPSAIPGNSKASSMVLYMRGAKMPRMPMGGAALTEDQILRIAKWIDQLPREDPKVALEKAENTLALAQKQLAFAEANVPAIEARIAADNAKYAIPPAGKLDELAATAQKVEQKANLLKAEENMLRAQQELEDAKRSSKPGDEQASQKKIAAARKALQAAAAALGQSAESYTPVAKPFPSTSSGRRTALANWIANKQNPLTARVAINHIWMRHFGRPLVPTVVNFGQNGKPPTHSALLDWLATEFMDRGWSMKAIHRLMVTSNTYRLQSSALDAKNANLRIDPDNRYYWRMNPRRMESELVRDSILSLAGQLDTTMGGPEIDERLADQSHRRSVYFRNTPESQVLFLKLFDEADPTDCYARTESIVPQQALAMANSSLTYAMSRVLAGSLTKTAGAGGDEGFISAAFETVMGEPPSEKERAASEHFLREQMQLLSDPKKLTPFRKGSEGPVAPAAEPRQRARENLVHALLNRNDFVTIR